MSDSQSSQQANTSTTDQRRVLGQGALSAENSSVSMTTISQTLDADVANHAVDAVRLSTAQALGFGSDALASSFNFAKSSQVISTNLASDALTSAFSFANDSAKRENAALDQTTQTLSTAYADAKGRGALTDKILIGAIAIAGLIALAALKK